jgi:hypothetical protein
VRRLLLSLALITAMSVAITAAPPSALADLSNSPANVTYTSSTMALQSVGTVNLAAASVAAAPVNTASALAASPAAVRFGAPPATFAKGGLAAASTINPASGVPSGKAITVQRDKQAMGFAGISGPQQAAVSGSDLEPPDQGTCAGPSGSKGTVTVEIVNNALSAYTPSGTQVLPVTPTFALFDQLSTTFLSDPRCYFDVQTQRWFFTELAINTGATKEVSVIH